MSFPDVIGALAGTCTTIATVPQIVKLWKTRSDKDISLRTFFLLFVGLSLWTLYGVLKDDWAIILTNGISSLLNGSLVIFVMVGRHRTTVAPRPPTARP